MINNSWCIHIHLPKFIDTFPKNIGKLLEDDLWRQSKRDASLRSWRPPWPSRSWCRKRPSRSKSRADIQSTPGVDQRSSEIIDDHRWSSEIHNDPQISLDYIRFFQEFQNETLHCHIKPVHIIHDIPYSALLLWKVRTGSHLSWSFWPGGGHAGPTYISGSGMTWHDAAWLTWRGMTWHERP